MELCADIHGPQMMSPTDYGGPLALPRVSLVIGHEIWYACPRDE